MSTTLDAAVRPPTRPSGARRSRPIWLVLLATALPMFMATLDNLVMTNALPVLHSEFGASVEELQWFMNAYTLAFASTILMAVALGDRFGRRTLFIIGIAVFTLSSALAALATDPGQLIAARAAQGFGAAAIMPLSLTLLAGAVPLARRPLAIGIWGGVAGLGVATGPLVGGAVIEGWAWQAIFWINVPVGVVSIALVLLALSNSFGARLRADIVGLALSGLGLLGIVYGIVRGNDAGWSSFEVLGSLIAGGLLLVGFVVWESQAPAPLLPLRLFRDRSFTVANLAGFGFSFGAFGSIFILIQFLQVVQGATPLEAAVQTSPWTLAPMVIAPLAGAFAGRVGTRIFIVAGLAALSAALFWLTTLLEPDTPYVSYLAPFILAGVGMGLVFAPSSTAVLATMQPDDHAKASGTNSMLREVGVALGIAVSTAVFTGAGGSLTPTDYSVGAVPAVVVGASVLLASALIALLLPAGRATPAAAGATIREAELVP
ncbi:DHA2 family efflux MFS transporter permease subunit [Agromyces cerinus]|uniref:Drug resistance transporter, EmrB/QacA subfamily n=1 Tax=Agromyces cerinus subsp. cerinus TaxID=232089 RepID=A0A1N6EN26_9MICO|nr:DHA2 family efflux MFS transporter permease subunit [Agromyces cerinus]SIN84499.1 drug resistance transporter, EmrB/QacA subfamily [Agromyces cerinus subsp. cerinus]